MGLAILLSCVCVCVYVCVGERESERESTSACLCECEQRIMASRTRGETERVIKWKAQAGLTDLVFPFHGEFHQQLLGVGANEDEWRGGLVAVVRILRRERERENGGENNEAGSGRKAFSSVVIDRKHAAEFEIDWHFHAKGDIYLICRGQRCGSSYFPAAIRLCCDCISAVRKHNPPPPPSVP